MTKETKERTRLALLNAAEMIRSHVEWGGIFPKDIGEEDEEGVRKYAKACERVSKMIEKLANRYITDEQ
jgi:beta-glucosidase/6-phospho-beta-glucosidase/beta-galactosidase